ncbi:hypothetical protein PVT68_05375 [Microbulbifer bruguierae]|uniref:VOC domain-containing protein n=1 Tax=Microbulbifer bruguierae TaxID=3029061 RepID=A0ABY8NFK9_9GAMM|nr:hypothetical protein [Microbulbifer bruguierae]WGL17726.1 hypothetical protein PVT68_05375 [Microbulbifer bruguierae]
MSGPAKSGAIVYSNNFIELSKFYREFFEMSVLRKTDDFVSLDKDGFNIIVHSPPFELPPLEFSAVKLFFTVSSIQEAKRKIVEFGGQAFEGEWSNPIFKVCNISDPEGNQIQLREFTL